MLPTRRHDLLVRVLDGEVVILDEQTGQVHRLNGTASYIWSCLDGRHTIDDIARDLADEFKRDSEPSPPDPFLKDVREAIDAFRQLRLLSDDTSGA